MPDWFVAGICVAVGYAIAARWPRRRRYTTAHAGLSVIPPGARPMPGDHDCVELGHRRLSWSERISFPWLLPWRGRRTEITEATCGECERPQTQLRIVYPPGYAIRLDANGPTAATEKPAAAVSGAGSGGDDAD